MEESDQNIYISTGKQADNTRQDRRKARQKWGAAETSLLVEGLYEHGVGNWKKILTDPKYPFREDRTAVDLKDRFRTLYPNDDLSSEVENGSEGDIFPYKCAIPGCPKAYKNANGLRYHNEHGHASQSGNGAREKPWACTIGGCLKTFSSKGGLIYHVKRCHPNDLWALP